MKPIEINLVQGKAGPGKPGIFVLAVLVCAAIGLTGVSLYEYSANNRVIATYETRLAEIRQKQDRQKKTAARSVDDETGQQEKEQLDILLSLVRKNLFPVLEVLTRIEKNKPLQMDIAGLSFSQELFLVTITAESTQVEAVSAFIENMKQTGLFDVSLARKEIRENHVIRFELAARWTGKKA